MQNKGIRHVVVFFLVVAALFTGTTYVYAATGRQLADSAIAALKSSAPASTSKNVVLTLSWSWLEVSFKDEQYPLTVDFLGSNFIEAKKVVYMLPGGGVNFASSFFTPMDNNLAQFFRKAGYLVVGITPREDSVPAGITDYSFMATWGMDKHEADIETIISVIQKRLKKPYRVLGHSFGAAYALDYASKYMDNPELVSIPPEKVIALDIYSYNRLDQAADSYELFNQKAAQPPYADASYTDMKSLALISLLLPKIDSGVSRGDGLGNFTFEGLLYFSLICSRDSGILETDWPLVQSYAAGVYIPAWCPLFDRYYLTKSDINTIRSASFMVGSGLVPYAVYRDWFDVSGDHVAYSIDWSDIGVPVIWINTALGYGPNRYCGEVLTLIGPLNGIGGYGHLDILLGRTAQDVWKDYNLDK
jgi:pimeloyl-ACP methyl ester carboxylesterase